MPFKYTCFISYRHVEFGLGQNFMNDFLNALKGHIELEGIEIEDDKLEPAFIDVERLKGGHVWNEALEKAICHSACMIVILKPDYFSKKNPYCAREYRAMMLLEEERKRFLGDSEHGLIIPIFLKGSIEDFPQEVKRRQGYDFSRYFEVVPQDITKSAYNKYINDIADYIAEVVRKLTQYDYDPSENCETHRVPPEDEVMTWLDSIMPKRVKPPPPPRF
jgi:TIR domain-containing protein